MANILAVAGPGSKYGLPGAKAAGFWAGLWHGLICPITFLVSLFSHNFRAVVRLRFHNWSLMRLRRRRFKSGAGAVVMTRHNPRLPQARSALLLSPLSRKPLGAGFSGLDRGPGPRRLLCVLFQESQ